MRKIACCLVSIVLLTSSCGTNDVVSNGAEPIGGSLDCADNIDTITAAMRSGQPVYDYDPAPNLAALVERTAVVLGPLTSITRDDSGEGRTIFGGGFEVVGGLQGVADTGFVESFGTFSSAPGGQDPLDQPMSLAGVTVVAFVVKEPVAPGGFIVDIQGLLIACGQGPVVEVIEPLPADAPRSSLNDLIDAVGKVGVDEAERVVTVELTLDDDTLAPGSEFVASFSEDFQRGGYYVLAPVAQDGSVGEPEFLLESHHNPGSPQVWPITNGEWGVNDYGVDGTTPDQLVLPADIALGEWQLCTANALDTVCVAITIS